MNVEKQRLSLPEWKNWGPYVSNRQWGTVREDYSSNSDAWGFSDYFGAMRTAYQWSEDAIAGICDYKQVLCFGLSLWNQKDNLLKERFFGLGNHDGNHGEDLKEIYYYLDSTPTHSYMKMLYKYPTVAFPYRQLLEENINRSKLNPEFEIADTGIFQANQYFDVFIEYAKNEPDDILIRIRVVNRSNETANLDLLPTIWFRNTWQDGNEKPNLHIKETENHQISLFHPKVSIKNFYSREPNTTCLFCENETNPSDNPTIVENGSYYKDGINNFLIHGTASVNPLKKGTKASFHIRNNFQPGEEKTFDFRLTAKELEYEFQDFDALFNLRKKEADDFYNDLQKDINSEEEKSIQRQSFAGLLWNKQFYHYNLYKWLKSKTADGKPREKHQYVRNREWKHMLCKNIISMPDKWEYPWFATWDLAFHCVPIALVDADFAKEQLKLLTKEWYMHPNGQLPAYEWDFGNVNPPVHAWSVFRVFKIDKKRNGKADLDFLENLFQKLSLNFTWWVNRKDVDGNNVYGGGFLGLDNIGAFDRNMEFQKGQYLEQADGTSWMAMFALNMMRISMELALSKPIYEEMAVKYFEHFLYIAYAMELGNEESRGLWDDEDGFFYDVLKTNNCTAIPMKLRSIIGIIPLFAVEVIDHEMLEKLPEFSKRMDWILKHRPNLANMVSHWEKESDSRKHLMSVLRKTRLSRVLTRMCDENEFLSDFGIRSMSKHYEKEPFEFEINFQKYTVNYVPAESDSSMFGGNSNWRGPIWFPINFLIIESLERYHHYYGDSFQIEFPTGSGKMCNLKSVSEQLKERLKSIFKKNTDGKRAFNGTVDFFNSDVHFKDYIHFFEYFHGDNGRGVGASHQCGWTGCISKIIHPKLQ